MTRQVFHIATQRKRQVVDITEQVGDIIRDAGMRDGVVVLSLLHTTAALTTADLDPGTDLDMLDAFAALIPSLPYRHPHDPSHVPDHILSALIGTSLTLVVEKGSLALGTWQRVVLVEFNGPRQRRIAFRFLRS